MRLFSTPLRGGRASSVCGGGAVAFAVFAGLAFCAGAHKLAAEEAPKGRAELTERERVCHVLDRLAFGSKRGLVAAVQAQGWKAWVEEQLQLGGSPGEALKARLEGFETLDKTPKQLIETYRQDVNSGTEEEKKRARKLRRLPPQELQASVLLRAVYSERQLEEVLVEFWRNHFNVSLNKDDVHYLATNYEREVIRKHVFGRFEDMLLASAKHPAMLIYLDNVLSQKPLSETEKKYLERAGRGKSERQRQLVRERGLNENYARELLELHTLGVDNGYKQRDVVDLARVLTGWSVSRGDKGTFEFYFNLDVHDLAKKRVLGWGLSGGKKGALSEGETIIRKLAHHKGTARFIAWKLCRYLVADDPDADLVKRVAKVFSKTKGDLRSVYRAVVFDKAFFASTAFRAKFKTPFEWTVSMLRAIDADIRKPERVVQVLQAMGQPIYKCEDPTGYYDTQEAWLDPGVLALRWQIALDLSDQKGGAVRLPKRLFRSTGEDGVPSYRWLAAEMVPSGVGRNTQEILKNAARRGGGAVVVQRRILAVLLGSPEFQRQ